MLCHFPCKTLQKSVAETLSLLRHKIFQISELWVIQQFVLLRISQLTLHMGKGIVAAVWSWGHDLHPSIRLFSRGALPEVDRSHPSGSLFLVSAFPSPQRFSSPIPQQ